MIEHVSVARFLANSEKFKGRALCNFHNIVSRAVSYALVIQIAENNWDELSRWCCNELLLNRQCSRVRHYSNSSICLIALIGVRKIILRDLWHPKIVSTSTDFIAQPRHRPWVLTSRFRAQLCAINSSLIIEHIPVWPSYSISQIQFIGRQSSQCLLIQFRSAWSTLRLRDSVIESLSHPRNRCVLWKNVTLQDPSFISHESSEHRKSRDLVSSPMRSKVLKQNLSKGSRHSSSSSSDWLIDWVWKFKIPLSYSMHLVVDKSHFSKLQSRWPGGRWVVSCRLHISRCVSCLIYGDDNFNSCTFREKCTFRVALVKAEDWVASC